MNDLSFSNATKHIRTGQGFRAWQETIGVQMNPSMGEQFETLLYLVRQTTGAAHAVIQFDGAPPQDVPEGLNCLEAPLVHQGRRFGVLRAYAESFESGAAHLLAGFAVLVVEQQMLWSEAHSDVLTKALTRRAFLADLGRAVATYQRSGTECSLIMFDLDHFKVINDEFGHSAGDAVLKAVAHVVSSELRPCDLVGRLGGEEFGVLIPASTEIALDIAERLRAVIEGTTVRDYPQVHFTSSFGVASCDPSTQTREDLITVADARLYAAKKAGRNRVHGPHYVGQSVLIN